MNVHWLDNIDCTLNVAMTVYVQINVNFFLSLSSTWFYELKGRGKRTIMSDSIRRKWLEWLPLASDHLVPMVHDVQKSWSAKVVHTQLICINGLIWLMRQMKSVLIGHSCAWVGCTALCLFALWMVTFWGAMFYKTRRRADKCTSNASLDLAWSKPGGIKICSSA